MATRPRMRDYDALTVPEKILRLQDLWDELDSESSELELTPEQTAEVTRRLDAFKAKSGNGAPWSVVKQRIRSRNRR